MKKIKFRTEIQPSPSIININHQQEILLAGSCFAENIGRKLEQSKFTTVINPLGIAFNPISLHRLLGFSVKDSDAIGLERNSDCFFHFDFHSDLNTLTENQFRTKIKQQATVNYNALKNSEILIISYGTAWVYEKLSDNQLVNNCHKVSGSNFKKRLLSVEEIVQSWRDLKLVFENHLSRFKQIIFTVSPIRHWKDGFRQNQLSKSVLHLAVNQICETNENCNYFPSYELLMDDLRDYRFYEKDLLHPSSEAIDYIWQKFSDCYFSAETAEINSVIEKFSNSLTHKAFQPKSALHAQFLEKLQKELQAFQKKHSISYEKELRRISEELLS
jgi:hypothetical protein